MGSEKHDPKDTLAVVAAAVEVKRPRTRSSRSSSSTPLAEAKQMGRPRELGTACERRGGAEKLDPKRKLATNRTVSSVVWLGLGSGGGGAR